MAEEESFVENSEEQLGAEGEGGATQLVQVVDEDGNPVFDEEGNPVMEVVPADGEFDPDGDLEDPENAPFDFEAQENRKLDRIEYLDQSTYAESAPSYCQNSKKEQLVLEYVENFRWQYAELYPKRADLLLCPPNECGVPKFVCTTLRPTQLEYQQLYDWDRCAQTVADFITYEPLHHPAKLPRHITSPSFTLQMQAGDAFDMATVLVSFLLGAGYDAYVVSGYAPTSCTERNEQKTICPILDVEEPPPPPPVHFLEGVQDHYQTHKIPDLGSRFLNGLEEKKRKEEEERRRLAELSDEEEDVAAEDPFTNRRVHAWVLVLAGKREVPDNFFIEPSTARRYEIEKAPYLGIEGIWNNQNYWVNMQGDPTDGSGVASVSFEMKDTSKWEYIFLDTQPQALDDGALDAIDEDFGDEIDKEANADLPKEQTEGGEQILDMPPSWVNRLFIPWETLEYRCPDGQKAVDYRKSKLEVFAPYKRADGMVLRLSIFKDTACTVVKEIREEFAFRRDKLVWRYTYPLEKKKHEHFDPGRIFNLKDNISIEDQIREFHFYSEARLDGRVKRVEIAGKKIFEVFENRDDHLIYRSVHFDNADKDKNMYGSSAMVGSDSQEMMVRKMTEKYERNEEIDAEQDVRKRCFYVLQGKIRLDYHYGPDRITASSRIYSKEGNSRIVQVDPFSKEPKSTLLLEEYTKLIAAERECGQEFRNSDREAKEILLTRKKEEENFENALTFSIYDTLRNKSKDDKEMEEKDDDAETKEPDYLAPFLLQFGKKRGADYQLSREEALQAKTACLKALKERLIERANIIQSRLDEENQALAKRQTAFQRNRDHVDKAEEEAYEEYCSQAMFRIQILEQRLARHEEQALQKYAETDMKLRQDNRLVALHS